VSALVAAIRELLGLFIDDGAFAIAILMVVGVAVLVARLSSGAHLLAGAILIAGCLAVLAISVARAARS